MKLEFNLYDGVKSVAELKADLLSDLQERFRELKAEGKDDETAFDMTVESIGDIDGLRQPVMRKVSYLIKSRRQQQHN